VTTSIQRAHDHDGPRRLRADQAQYLQRWYRELGARPGVQRGMEAGKDLSEQLPAISGEEKERLGKLLYNQRARPAPEGGLA